jgi:hypothetical protein
MQPDRTPSAASPPLPSQDQRGWIEREEEARSAAQGRPETLDEFMARNENVLASNSVKRIAYVTGRPIDQVLADLLPLLASR